MLNLGMITPEEAKRLIVEDTALDESWAQNEIERYTYSTTSYSRRAFCRLTS